MASANLNTLSQTAYPVLADAYSEARWYAVRTCANHEKRVAAQLGEREVEHFLPLYRSVRRWKDRRVELELPLFPGYVFAHVAFRERLRVLQIPSVAQVVGFGGRPAALPDEQIAALRTGLGNSRATEPHPYLAVGRRVRVVGGPLTGLEGIIVRKKNHFRFVISLNLIMRSVSVELNDADIVPAV